MAHSYSYLDWHNPHSYPFCVHLPLIKIARTQFFIRWMECNTPLPEYVLSCVFVFSDRIFFDLLPVFILYYELFIWSYCLGFGFVNSESALVWTGNSILVDFSIWSFVIPNWPISVLNTVFQYFGFSMIFWNFPGLNWKSSKPVSISTADRLLDF